MSGPTSIPFILARKRWFGFDLDDTLHEFRKASAQASLSVFESINSKHGISIEALESKYKDVLQNATANAFTDGRSSTDYRRDRFTRLLQAHGINETSDEGDQSYMNKLLDQYQSSLRSSLTLKQGTLALLQALKKWGKSVIVITEGPTDSQEWTIHELGLEPYIDVLVTTNEMGCSKVDGLFGIVLENYGIRPEEIVYFGDNATRDIQSSQKEGILAILYDEKQKNQLVDPVTLRINSWEALEDLLGKELEG